MVTGADVSPMEAMADERYRRELGHGLLLRWSTPDDVERVATLYARAFQASAAGPPNWHLPIWARDMFSGRHPHIGPRDFALVEDTRSGTVAAATCLLGYTIHYEGIPLRLGRPEAVASLPEYRRQGLIRAIFALIHARSAARGDLVQGITGIPFYYRQFGYEYAARLNQGLTVYFPAIPALQPGMVEPYRLREATLEDVPLLCRVWARHRATAAVWTEIEPTYWRWVMAGMHPDALERWRVYVIAAAAGAAADSQAEQVEDGSADGRPVGALILFPGRWGVAVNVTAPMVDAGVPLVQVLPAVLRGVQALAETTRPVRPETPPAGAITFWGGQTLRGALGDLACVEPAYPEAWYLRVADLPRFFGHVTPVLERRLAQSAHAGYTGELTLDFYRAGLRLVFENGRLTVVEDWRRPVWGEAKAGFPPLVFLQVLFGYRSLHELRRIYPDVWAAGDAAPLLDALFPKCPTLLMPLD
jgi:hypothetical protein